MQFWGAMMESVNDGDFWVIALISNGLRRT